MIQNLGQTDRIIRTLVGVILIGAGIYFKSYWGLIGLIPLATAYLRWCPAYLPFHISTCKSRNA